MKRFYKEVAARKTGAGIYGVMLDGKPVRTPGGSVLKTPHQALSREIAKEWEAQQEQIDPAAMPLTQILSTQIDRAGPGRADITRQLLKYLDTDLLCYPAAEPPGLVQMQDETWRPLRTWFEEHYGAVLKTTTGLQAIKQDKKLHKTVRSYIDALRDDRFTVFHIVTSLSGSLILALAFIEQEAGAEEVFNAARVEEKYKAALYNEAKYGPDPLQDQKERQMLDDLKAAERFLMLISWAPGLKARI